ncbi:TOMM precursor leader peptide-binding protein [Actinomadura sp. DC4]|uniref:TOMM precursor leader peptide-binding protein n=1 Tax=Actinomadura sp. DC4 TaxID=3055069 RepID=UPI0025B1D04F|nr:TOMM precursor leader peptide-binding protein [Actinomadura sp. DC4]MDN3352023.1 TOMM precursor leader peptide-binding protein [Actinomadura sp. DC4]
MTGATSIVTAPAAVDPAVRAVRDYLAACGLPVEPDGGPLYVDVDTLGLPGRTETWSGAEAGAVLPVRLYTGTVVVGPLFTGAGRPCVVCLQRRFVSVRPLEERGAIDQGLDAYVAGVDPRLSPFALEAIRLLVEAMADRPRTGGSVAEIRELRPADLTVTRQELVADSECPRCAAPRPDTAEAAVVRLEPRPKPSATEYRLRSVEELDLPVAGYANPVCGAVTGALLPAYQCTATAPVSGFFRVRSRYDYHEMWWSGQAQSLWHSERYGLLEGLERYAGQFPRARSADVFGTYADLAPDALDPRACGEYAPEFYAHHAEFYAPFDPDTPMHWTWGYSLRDERPVLVPEQLVFYLDRRPYKKFVQECSNGCASGSCVEEAVLHAMLELLERDAFLLSWYSAARLPEIDLESCRDPRVRFMRDRIARLGYGMRLFDMRADLPVPAVMAVAERRDGRPGTLCFGAGAGFDPEDAVRSAMSETASYVPGFDERVIARRPQLTAMVDDYDLVHELAHHSGLYGLPEMARHAGFLFDGPPPRPMEELYAGWLDERPAGLDLSDDVRFLTGRFTALGGDVIVVDQTCPEQEAVGIHTVSVIAPGLIPIDFGWQRQRVLHHPRLHDFLAGRLSSVQPPGSGYGPAGLHPRPHPFP